VSGAGWVRRMTADIGEFGLASGANAVMNTAWGWPIAECVHFVGICLLIGTVGLFDLRMMGAVHGPSLPTLHRMVPWGVAGWLLCLASGAMFVLAAPFEYVENPAWVIKMVLIALAGVNMVIFYRTVASRVRHLPEDAPVPLAARVVAVVSLASWLGVMTCGRVITAFRPLIE